MLAVPTRLAKMVSGHGDEKRECGPGPCLPTLRKGSDQMAMNMREKIARADVGELADQQYTPDGRNLFCGLCGRTSIRHIIWHGKRLCNLPKQRGTITAEDVWSAMIRKAKEG